MVKNITTIAFNSLEVEKITDINNNNISFNIDTPPIIIKNKAILKVSNFCHIGSATNHTDNMYLFRIKGVNVDTSKFIAGSRGGGNPLILTTTFNNNRSLYDENIITLIKQTINSIDIIVDTYLPFGTFTNLNILNVGSGYLQGQILKLTGGGGTDVSILIDSVLSGGISEFSFINTPDNTYTLAPSLSTFITGSSAILTAVMTGTAPNQTIASITINNAGKGYKVGQTLAFSGGGGTGAVISISTVNVNGGITGFTITNAGSGYSSAPSVSINATTQTQTAILMPQMKYGRILNNSIPNSLNFSITFIIEEDVNE